METQKFYRSAIELLPERDASAFISEDIVEKLETTAFQCRLDALQQTMNVFGTSFQGAGAAEKVDALQGASDYVSAAGAKVTKDAKDEIEKGLRRWVRGPVLQLVVGGTRSTPRRCRASVLRARLVYHDVADQGSAAWRGRGVPQNTLTRRRWPPCRVKVKVGVTEKFSYGTLRVYANLGG